MRITESLTQSQFLAALGTLQDNLAKTQNQLSSNLSFTTASQNPTAAGNVNAYDQALSQSQQFTTNANSAQTNLSTEDNALSQVQTQLQSLRNLALQANNGGLSNADLSSIATQASQIQSSLVSLANTQNGNGEYIFGGFAAQTPPFAASATGATYNGDQGQRQVAISAGQTLADGDNGHTVFNLIGTGNGVFAVSAKSANSGGGIIGATAVTDPTAYDKGTYAINFLSPTSYEVRDASNALVASGNYVDGQSVAFKGVQVTLTGAPAAGDSFSVVPSSSQSVFTTVQNLVSALRSGVGAGRNQAALSNSVGNAIDNIDQALNKTATVRASVGGRLNSITTQLSVASSTQIQLQATISSLQGLDYASAITSLTQQTTTLSAALQSYRLTQGLTLFKYL